MNEPNDTSASDAELIVFLRACLDEDERIALAVANEDDGPHWEAASSEGDWYVRDNDGTVAVASRVYPEGSIPIYEEDARHIARHDPARVRAEVQAKRKIVDTYEFCIAHPNADEETGYWVRMGETGVLEETLHLLALPYADQPGYRDEWRRI